MRDGTLDRWKIVIDFVREHDVSDISLWGENLTARMDGQIVRLSEAGALSKNAVSEMIRELLMSNPELVKTMSKPMASVDFTMGLFDKRFRINIARARGELFASLRPLPENAPEPGSIGLSSQFVKVVTEANGGLLLITGPTGSGKTTTIASLVDEKKQVETGKNYNDRRSNRIQLQTEESRDYPTGDWFGFEIVRTGIA
jgi:twitching motility protein PilT